MGGLRAGIGKIGSSLAGGLTAGVSGPLAAALAAAFGAVKVVEAANDYQKLQNQLKVTGLEGEHLTSVFESLAQIALKNGSPIESLVQLYSRMSLSAKDLGASQSDMLSLTGSVALALRVQGTTAQEASGALLQLAQALGGGTVQAEEYNSLLDGMPALLRATAAGLTEAGGSVSKLTQLVKSGQVSSEAFFRATLAGTQTLADQAAKTTGTIGQAWQNVETALTQIVGQFNDTADVTGRVAGSMNQLAAAIAAIPSVIADASASVADLEKHLTDLASRLPVLSDIRRIAQENSALGAAGAQFGSMINGTSTRKLAPGEVYGPVQQVPAPPPVKPVSLKDFSVSPKTKSGSGAGSSRKSPDDRFDRSLDTTREQIAQLEAERAGLTQTTAAREKAAETVKLYADAKRAGLAVDKEGIPVDATVRQRVDELSSAYGRAAQALDDAREKQQQFGELQQFIGDNLSSFFSDIVTGSATVEDSLKRIVSALGDAALQAALLGQGPLAGLFGTAGAGGKTGGLIGSLSGLFGARASGGPVQGGKTYLVGENGPEMVRFGSNGTVVPNAALRSGGGGGGIEVNVINQNGSDVQTQTTQTPSGTRLDVMVKGVIARDFSSNGPLAQQFQKRYGVSRMGGRR
ncbi:tape measure protein [Chelatococcus sp. GCM10030263]|uniref:tape measure protein n=1 Tax=Chelatococcus sp. GCM10030263 TaxID=3273387 RepID=UPI00361F57FA